MIEPTPQTRRPDRADLAIGLVVGVAFLFILWLGRGMTFFADEWAVIMDRPISMDSFLQPFNEHWLGLTTLVYRLLLERVGLTTYLPYLGLLLALHVVVVLEVYVLVRRAAGAWLAVLAGSIFALLGSGFENLYWAMQIGFVGAIALGLGAVLLLDGAPGRGRVTAATALMTLGMMTSGFGIFMLAFAGLDLLLDPRRRRMVLALFVPAGVYLAWYLAFGRTGLATHRDPFTFAALLDVPWFVIDGAGTAIGAAVGVGPVLGRVVGAGLLAWIAWCVVRGGPGSVPSRALAALGAILVQYAILATLRAQLFEGAAEYSRYAYLSAIFALVGITSLIGHRRLLGPGSWRLARMGGLVAMATLAITWNLWLLIAGRAIFLDRADASRAKVIVATSDLPPGIDPDKALILDRPASRLRVAVDRFGSPLTDTLAGDAVRPVPPSLVDAYRSRIAAGLPVP